MGPFRATDEAHTLIYKRRLQTVTTLEEEITRLEYLQQFNNYILGTEVFSSCIMYFHVSMFDGC